MSVLYSFTVPILPRGWARARTKDGRYFVDAKTSEAKEQVAWAFRQACAGPLLEGAVGLTIRAFFPFPKSTAKKVVALDEAVPHVKKPDSDNVSKLVCDALNGIAWRDDAQVCDLQVRKRYSRVPRIEIEIVGREV